MADLTSVTNFINSPPGQLVAGGILALCVWKFFERVENVLTESRRGKIAHWLRVKNLETEILSSSDLLTTFGEMFDAAFGPRHFSLRCVLSSLLCTSVMVFFAACAALSVSSVKDLHGVGGQLVLIIMPSTIVGCMMPDYISLFEARHLTRWLSPHRPIGFACLSVLLDVAVKLFLGAFSQLLTDLFFYVKQGNPSFEFLGLALSSAVTNPIEMIRALQNGGEFGILTTIRPEPMWISFDSAKLFLLPSFFSSFWLWLFLLSSISLRAMRRFSWGFGWFNSNIDIDIEKKPLSAIGLVAGSLVALLYWTWAVFRHFVPA